MNICPETRFYVYITRNTPDTEYTQGFKFSVKDLFNEGKNGIEWLNPPPSDEGLGSPPPKTTTCPLNNTIYNNYIRFLVAYIISKVLDTM